MSSASSDLRFTGGGRTRALTIRRSAAARAMRLSVDPRDGTVRLSLPARAALRPALAWAEEKRGWIEGALAVLPRPQPIVPGATIPFEGRPVLVEWRPGGSRAVSMLRHPDGSRDPDSAPSAIGARLDADFRQHDGREHDRLVLGGPEEAVAARVLRWLRRAAAIRLEAETRALAAQAGVTVGRVGVGDPRSRWGSCAACGDIRYSWRLILAPPDVRAATVAHEVAHRLHMDHSPAFHAAVARLLGREPQAERRWLRTHGSGLYWLGRDS